MKVDDKYINLVIWFLHVLITDMVTVENSGILSGNFNLESVFVENIDKHWSQTYVIIPF
jgi:hypothetical protein